MQQEQPVLISNQAAPSAAARVEENDIEKGSAIDSISVQSQDVKTRQDFKGWTLVYLGLQSIGACYGDIGTSPLYVFSSTFTEPPAKDELVCAVSLVIYALTIMVTIKYVCIAMFADDAGEGGTFALYSLLARYAKIEDKEPGKASKGLDRYLTSDIGLVNRSVRSVLENKRTVKLAIRMIAIFGACCVMADGVFTPAQSVLGAIQGARVYNPDLSTGAIIGISCAIIVLLFALQPFGVSRLAPCFAPIVVFWLLLNAVSGIYNLAVHDASIMKAFNPYYAGRWFTIRGSDAGFRRLGGILLCFTGVEAMFADMGAFSRKSVQLSWLCFVWPCLLLTYIGQAAHLSVFPEKYTLPVFNTLPPGMFWPGLISSILAAIVASQAMITGTFQIISQATSLCYLPRIRIKFTSTVVHGQCYVPLANWLLMVGCVIVTGVFNNTTSLGNAYGLSVILVTMVTTLLVTLVAVQVWCLHPFFIVLPVFAIFITWDGLFLSISLFKVPDGAYITLIIAAVLSTIMCVWRYGKTMQWEAEGRQLQVLHEEIAKGKESREIDGVGIFFDETDARIPAIYAYWLRSFEARHRITVFTHLRQTYHPTVSDEDRFTVRPVPDMANTFYILLRFGYNEPHSAVTSAPGIIDAIAAYLEKESNKCGAGSPRAQEITKQQAALAQAKEEKAPVYIFGRKDIQLSRDSGKNIIRNSAIKLFIFMRDIMTSKPRLWKLPSDQIVEIGKAVVI